MDRAAILFVGSALSQICAAGYAQLAIKSNKPILLQHSAVNFKVSNLNTSVNNDDHANNDRQKQHLSGKNDHNYDALKKLYSSLELIIAAHPLVPPFYAFFDVHGQLQTTVQFMVRHFFILCGYILPQSLSWRVLGLPYGRLVYKREAFTLSDGGVIALDWASIETQETSVLKEELGTVIIYHGLGLLK